MTRVSTGASLVPVAALLIGVMCSPPCVGQGLQWSAEQSAAISAALERGEYGSVTSVLIERGGSIVYERYLDDADASEHRNLRSVGKTVTGMVLGAAIDDGFIDNEDVRAATFFEELRPFEHPDSRKDAITIKDLLTMSGPLECNDWNSYSRGNEERMYLVEDWSAFFWNLPIKNRPSWELPEDDGGFGRLYSYCTAGAQLLGEIVQRAVGEPFTEYAQRRLFDRIGIAEPKWNFAATGTPHLGGGLELTTRDWARVGRLALTGGRVGDEHVLSAAWVASSLDDYVQIEPGVNYGYLWWRVAYEVGDRRYVANMMTGSGGNRVYVLPEFAIVAIITKNDFRDANAHATSDALFQAAIVERLHAN